LTVTQAGKMVIKVGEIKMSNENALGQFMANIEIIKEQLNEIGSNINDHMGFSPEEICWGHVAESARVIRDLNDVIISLGLRKEE